MEYSQKWMMGKIAGTPIKLMVKKPWLPVGFPLNILNQSIEIPRKFKGKHEAFHLYQDDLAALRQVLESKGDPNCANAAGWTPLILSAMADRLGVDVIGRNQRSNFTYLHTYIHIYKFT